MSPKTGKPRMTKVSYNAPSEYMRARRPELFSDTLPLTVPVLEKSLLEYHLETLTNRKQELTFEDFCRRLAELEICPNLIPHTGPIGGGDSKTDTSTYPVAERLAERCWWGSPKYPSDEAWAFAFSCKKDWKAKLKLDAKNIANLDKSFPKVYFITNQFVRDKKRAEVEADLSRQYKFELHILDRSWIVEKVINNKREDLAIEMLGIKTGKIVQKKSGPRDIQRQHELDDLFSRLGQPELYKDNDYALAQDYMRAAMLSRGLEKPRHEIDGLFNRAMNFAKKLGSKGQIIRCGYNHGWTSLWWFDDSSALEIVYSDIEKYLPGTIDSEECELFFNLWNLLGAAVIKKEISPARAKLESRLKVIKTELRRLIAEKNRPNNALHAETIMCLIELMETYREGKDTTKIFNALKKCLKKSVGLGTYPAMQFINMLSEMGEHYGGFDGYESLFVEMRKIAKERFSEISVGRLLYNRGIQLAGMGKSRDVLRYLGQARAKLAKEETLQESIHAFLGCADAYMQLGLFWAARMEALTAAHFSLRNTGGEIAFPMEGIMATIRMGWLELSLGRVSPFIAWFSLSMSLLGNLLSKQYNVEALADDLRIQEGVLGCLFLNIDAKDLNQLNKLSEGLQSKGLSRARLALLYALGETETILDDCPTEFNGDRSKLQEFFNRWKKQPAAKQLPRRLPGESEPYCNYKTTIMGVSYCVRTRNSFGPIVFSENLLGVVEAALAIATWENLAFIVKEVKMLVDIDNSGRTPPSLELDKRPDPRGYRFIWLPNMLEWLATAGQQQIVDYLMKFLLKLLVFATIDEPSDLKKELASWHKNDTFSRALGMSPISIQVTNLIGEKAYDIGFWSNPTASSQV